MAVNRLFYILSLIFFGLMLIIPTTHQFERGVLLSLLLIAAIVYSLLTKSWSMHREIFIVSLVCLITSIFFTLLGILNGFPGALKVSTVYVIWPLIFLFVMGVFNSPNNWLPFLKVIVIGNIYASLIAIMVVLEQLGYFHLGLLALLGEGTRVGVTEHSIGYSSPNLVTVIYALPFLLGMIMLPRNITRLDGAWRLYVFFSFMLSVIVLLISGRRAFWVISVFSPVLVILLSILCNVKIKLGRLGIFAVIIILLTLISLLYLGIDVTDLWKDFVRGFDFSNSHNIDAYARKEQFFALLHGWVESPLIGFGQGGGAKEYIRSDLQPWSYELSYMALLFHTGLLGFVIYVGAVFWLFYKSIWIARRRNESAVMVIPLLTGLLCFLVANVSNPYLEKFDYLWTLFLPVAVLNAYLLDMRKKKTL